MSTQNEPYYTCEQINIPPQLPNILKQFTKAAIKTQPRDLLTWSAAYFRAISENEEPPVKDRVEMQMATQKTDTGLSPGLLSILNKQLGPKKSVELSLIKEKWLALALPNERFEELVGIGGFDGEVDWLKFFALGCSSLSENIGEAMKMICELLTSDAEGGASRIQFKLFQIVYSYLAQVDGEISSDHIENVYSYLSYYVDRQDGFVQPRNFMSRDCPKLSG